MGDLFRLGLIGAGRVMLSCHLPAALGLPEVKVAALVDPEVERTKEKAQNYGVEDIVTGNLEEVLEKIDGAIIATPNHLHARVACPLLEAGIPVLIEKPLAASIEDGQLIAEAALRSNTVAGVGYCTRFQDNISFLGESIERNFFGSIDRFAYQSGTRGGWAPYSAYNLSRQATGGGVVMVTGTHFLDRMLAWFGMPTNSEYYDDGVAGPESNAVLQVNWERKARAVSGVIRFSKTCPLTSGLVMDTEKGRVIMKENAGDWPILKTPDNDNIRMTLTPVKRSPYPPDLNNFQRQLIDFIAACRERRDPRVPLAAGLDSLSLIHTMYAQRQPLPAEFESLVSVTEAMA